MGYIMMRAPKGMPKGDPKLTFWGTVGLFIWVLGILIIPDKSTNIMIIILKHIWFIVPVIILGLLALFIIIGITLYQTKIRFPNFFDKLPVWVKKLC